MHPETFEEILSIIRQSTVACVTAVDANCTNASYLLAVGVLRVANFRGGAIQETILAKTRRAVTFKGRDPIIFLTSLADEAADCVMVPEFLNSVCVNDGRDIMRQAKRAASKVAIVTVPHMRQGEKSVWRAEDLLESGFDVVKVGREDREGGEWMVGVWRRAER